MSRGTLDIGLVIRFVDRRRLAKKIVTLDEVTFQKLMTKIIEVCFPNWDR